MQEKPWVVQKYGGTSIGKLLPTITGSIIPSYLSSSNIAVVCSARSGTTKNQGTTSLLLDAIRLATSSETNTTGLDEVINLIKAEHLEAAQAATRDGADVEVLQEVELAVKKDCEQLRSTLKATWTLGEISDRTTDRVLSGGELLACRIVAASLMAKVCCHRLERLSCNRATTKYLQGIPSQVIVLDDIVQEAYGGKSRDQSRAFKTNPAAFLRGLTDAIWHKISACSGSVPIITGFFGAMPDSLIQSVGRGYSDLCAALCAVALNAKELQIWKEVDGIFTADPRKVKAARLLSTVTSEEAAELTYYGSEVIHPLTVEQIDTAGMLLRLKNVMNPQGDGTIIFPHASSQSAIPDTDTSTTAKAAFMTKHGYYGPNSSRRTPTAVTAKDGVCVLNIRSNGTAPPASFFSRITTILERHSITIDLISSSQQMLSLAVYYANSSSISDAIDELEALGSVSLVKNMSIVSVVGHKMRNMVGTASEIFSALARARVNIYLISQGASEINISYVALRAIDPFFLYYASLIGCKGELLMVW